MTQNERQSFDEFKDKVYDDIKFLELLDREIADELKPALIVKDVLAYYFRGCCPSTFSRTRIAKREKPEKSMNYQVWPLTYLRDPT
jgi:hypothetical protein